eukprot:1032608-Pyramimonas_sp.AAC.1
MRGTLEILQETLAGALFKMRGGPAKCARKICLGAWKNCRSSSDWAPAVNRQPFLPPGDS